jgi:adenylate cyclase
MSGNVGSLRRLEYTVHGDTVNTAARIESLTKTLAGPILLSESTRAALLRPPGDLRAVGEVEVRGRQSAVALWAVDAAATTSQSATTPPSTNTRSAGDRSNESQGRSSGAAVTD